MKKVKIILIFVIFLLIVGINLDCKAATQNWTNFENVILTLVDRGEAKELQYDLKFENVTFDTNETTKYYVFITNNSNSLDVEKTESVLQNSATEVWTSSSEKIVPYNKMNKFIDTNKDAYVWIIEGKSSDGSKYEYKEVLHAKKIKKPELGSLRKRINTSFFYHYGEMSIIITIREPYDNSVERKATIKIGKVTDYDSLLSAKNGNYNKLLNYAKETQALLTKTEKLKSETNIFEEINMEIGNYYYVYTVVDTENNKYRSIEDISLYQYIYYPEDITYYADDYRAFVLPEDEGFSWDEMDLYKPEEPKKPENPTPTTSPTIPEKPTEPENPTIPNFPTYPTFPTIPEGTTESIEPEKPTSPITPTIPPEEPTEPENPTSPTYPTTPEEPKDDTVAKEDLPNTGEKIIINSLIILILVFTIYYGIKIKKMKDIK